MHRTEVCRVIELVMLCLFTFECILRVSSSHTSIYSLTPTVGLGLITTFDFPLKGVEQARFNRCAGWLELLGACKKIPGLVTGLRCIHRVPHSLMASLYSDSSEWAELYGIIRLQE